MMSRSGNFFSHFGDGREIDRGVLADRRVRTAAGLDAHDAFGFSAPASVRMRASSFVDVVGDRRDLEFLAQ